MYFVLLLFRVWVFGLGIWGFGFTTLGCPRSKTPRPQTQTPTRLPFRFQTPMNIDYLIPDMFGIYLLLSRELLGLLLRLLPQGPLG